MVEQSLIEKQHGKGKLYITERLHLLFDDGRYSELTDIDNRDGVRVCTGNIFGQSVVSIAQDFTYKGGSLGFCHGQNILHGQKYALQNKLPIIFLNDSGGARIQEGIDSLTQCGKIFKQSVISSGKIPQISVILGSCAGSAVYLPALTDFTFMVKNISQMYITGPSIVKEVMGETVTSEELGGSYLHGYLSGNSDFVYETEEICINSVRKLISYIAIANKEYSCIKTYTEPEFNFKLPQNKKEVYDIHSLINSIVDKDSFFEIKKDFAQSIVVGLSTLKGKVVGIIANNPYCLLGILNCDSSIKAARFIRFCDSCRIPLISFTDVPGYLPGLEEEAKGIIRHGAKLIYAFSEATVAKINVILRRAYGGAYIAMNSKALGADKVYAWPDTEISVLGPESAVKILYSKQMKDLPDDVRETFRAEMIEKYRRDTMSNQRYLEKRYIDSIILPENTRIILFNVLNNDEKIFVHENERILHGNIPL